MSVTELHALISLLEDPDEGIFSTVKQELEKIGEAAVPSLRRALEEEGHGTVFVARAKALLDQLATQEVRSLFADWIESADHGVAEALLLINQYVDPAAGNAELKETLHRIRQDIWLELNDDMTALEQVRILNHILYDVENFTNAKSGQPDPNQALL
ncbi:MAG: hypothetical protein ACPHCT_06755, partial [Flavobacteriales bacterium]